MSQLICKGCWTSQGRKIEDFQSPVSGICGRCKIPQAYCVAEPPGVVRANPQNVAIPRCKDCWTRAGGEAAQFSHGSIEKCKDCGTKGSCDIRDPVVTRRSRQAAEAAAKEAEAAANKLAQTPPKLFSASGGGWGERV